MTSHLAISCLTEDIEGNLWVGTMGGGLNRLRPRTLEMVAVPEKFHAQPVRSVTEDAAGRLWIVLESGELARQEGTSWEILTAQSDWPGGKVNCVAADAKGAVWLGTQKGGLGKMQDGKSRFWRQADGLTDDAVRTVLVSSKGETVAGVYQPEQDSALPRWHVPDFRVARVGTCDPRADRGPGWPHLARHRRRATPAHRRRQAR